MTRLYWFWYWLLHKVTGRPVVLFMEHYGDESLRLVRYRIRFRARRPCVRWWSDFYVLCEGGDAIDSLSDLETWHRKYNAKWTLVHGSFKPSVIAHFEGQS